MKFGKVAVLMGGPSAEREISLISGKAVLEALRSRGVDAHAFDPAERELFDLKREGFERVFIALHGRFGEDGTVQGALEVMRIPYTGSGVMASALAMDKWRTKLVWHAAGIPTPRFAMVDASTQWEKIAELLGLPVIVKPSREGSTIGLTKVTRAEGLQPAYELAARYDSMVLAEEFVAGKELTASILGEVALPLVRIEAPQGNYDYQNKYFTDETRYFCPSGLEARLEDEIRAVALRSFRMLGCRGWGRADVMVRADGSYSFLEMNTSPGMTGHSLVPIAARGVGIDYAELCVRILGDARLDSPERR
jgi:D-alanine-D-alanine ligase